MLARKMNPAADHAAERVVLYDLHRPGAPELPAQEKVAQKGGGQ